MARVAELVAAIDGRGDAGIAAHSSRFFKSGPGEYGEGDRFVGVRVPVVREICRQYRYLSLEELDELLASPIHEHRLAALVILTGQSERARRRGDLEARRVRCEFYLSHLDRINNWDLVDLACREVVGEYLHDSGGDDRMRALARSRNLWERRTAMVGTLAWIRAGELDLTFELSAQLLGDDEDLIHKATGWMLRECGKRDAAALERFLSAHAASMPRTALRYAIERLPEQRRKQWLNTPRVAQ